MREAKQRLDIRVDLLDQAISKLSLLKKGLMKSVGNKTLVSGSDAVKEEWLEKAMKKPVREFVQYDVFFKGFDSVVRPGTDGLCLFYKLDRDLRNSDCIRLTFTPDTSPFIVLKALDKIRDCVEHSMSESYKGELNRLSPKRSAIKK